MQVEKVVKGPTADGDVVDVRMIQIPYHTDQQELDKVRSLAVTGRVSVAVRSAEDLTRLPLFLQPKPAAAPAGAKPKAPLQPADVPKEDAPVPVPGKDRAKPAPKDG
jgi:hypothetical protein